MVKILTILLVLASLGSINQAQHQVDQKSLDSAIKTLKTQTNIPFKIPTYFPHQPAASARDKRKSLFVTALADADSFNLGFCFSKTICPGDPYWAELSGERITPQTQPKGFVKTVTLARGITGYFSEISCGSNCVSGSLTWDQEGFQYSVYLKGIANLKAILQFANSAINNISVDEKHIFRPASQSENEKPADPVPSEIKRPEDETPEHFAKRNAPSQFRMTHQVVETEVWGPKKIVIAFYERHFYTPVLKESILHTEINGYLFIPKSPGTYEKILIYNFGEEGGAPEIKAVFFANADRDPAPELIVICSWMQVHYDFRGTLYQTFIFDDLRPGSNPPSLTLLEKVSDQVSGGCDCEYRDGTKPDKKFRTAAQVKAGLKKLGFR